MSDLFEATWESATLSITAYNPVEKPDIDPLTRKNVITVTGHVYILDTNDLIAVSTIHATALQVLDQDGNEVIFDPNAVVQSPGHTWMLGDQPKTFSVELRLDPNQACPTSLSELDFAVDALYGQPFSTAILPLETTEDGTELSSRYRVRVAEANVVDDLCHLVIEEEIQGVSGVGIRSFDPNDGPWEESVDPRGRARKITDLVDFIVTHEIIDAEGNLLRNTGPSRYSLKMGTATFRLTLYDCTNTKGLYVRYTFAIGIYKMPIRLTLTDIPVPGL